MNFEEDVRAALASVAAEARPAGTWAPVEARIRRAHRRRVLTGAIVAVAVVSAGAAATRLLPHGRDTGVVSPAGSWRTYHDSGGWSLRYPASWRVQPFEHQCRISRRGVAATNLDAPLEQAPNDPAEGACPADWKLFTHPNDLVIVEVFRSEGGALGLEEALPDTIRPFDLEGATRSSDSIGRILYRTVVAMNGRLHTIRVWLGPEASGADRDVAERIVASIAPGAEGPMEAFRRAALADPETDRRLAGTRFRAVEYRQHGPADGVSPCKPRPCVHIRFYVYTDDSVWGVSLNPGTRAVLWRGPETPEFLSLSSQERSAAHRIADADLEVRRMYGIGFEIHSHPSAAYDLNEPDGRPCGSNRCAEVVYEFPGPRYLVAYVNLVSERVVKVTRRSG